MPQLSQVLSRLHQLYEDVGLSILGSFSTYVSGGNRTGTYVARGTTVLCSSGGIAVDEMAFAYGLSEIVQPTKILVIGNAYGISTLFCVLANPDAVVIAIDKFRTTGISVTNGMLSSVRVGQAPTALAIQASTPDDLTDIVAQHLDGSVDLVLVDAVHENDVQTAEFRALEPLLSPKGAVLFHDVIACALTPSISELKSEYPGFDFVICPRTSSGVAVAFRSENPFLREYLAFWTLSSREVANFDILMQTRGTEQRAAFFEDVPTALSFPPHPQL